MRHMNIDGSMAMPTTMTIKRRMSECLTYLVWRMGGNTVAWASAVGFLEEWDPSAAARIQALWAQALVRGDPEGFFSDAMKPASFLWVQSRQGGDQNLFWAASAQILEQVSMLWQHAIPTLAHLVMIWPQMPFMEMCRVLCGAPYFGDGGRKGYDFAAPYNVDPARIPSFWPKEIVQDCLGNPGWGGAHRNDMLHHAPVGDGSRKGLGLALCLIASPSDPIPVCLLGSLASDVMAEIFAMKEEFGCSIEDVPDVNCVQWNFCEFKKIWVRVPRRLRNSVREGQCLNVLPVQSEEELPQTCIADAIRRPAPPAPPHMPPALARLWRAIASHKQIEEQVTGEMLRGPKAKPLLHHAFIGFRTHLQATAPKEFRSFGKLKTDPAKRDRLAVFINDLCEKYVAGRGTQRTGRARAARGKTNATVKGRMRVRKKAKCSKI